MLETSFLKGTFAYLPSICARLPDRRQEMNACHPFTRAESGFPSEVMHVTDQSFKDVGEPSIRSLRVDANGIFRDIVSGQVFHRQHRSARGTHPDLRRV